jgi:hypothetical protein
MYIIIASSSPITTSNVASSLNCFQSIPVAWQIFSVVIIGSGFLFSIWRFKADIREEIISYITKDDFLHRLASLSHPSLA